MTTPPTDRNPEPATEPVPAAETGATTAATDGPRVADLDESELLARIGPLLPIGPRTVVPTGDDCAVLAPSDGRVCVTTDILVEGRHFRRDWGDPYRLGLRASAQNLADVAGMGAAPISMVVGLALPGDVPVSWVEDLARGLGDAARAAGAGVDGGDLSSGDSVVVAVTALGDLEGRAPVLRSGARPGDVVAHAGVLGRGAAGYALLDVGLGDAGSAAWAVEGFLAPEPPLAAGPAGAAAGASAMMDVSDGLLRDAERIARASRVVVDLDDPDDWADLAALLPPALAVGEARAARAAVVDAELDAASEVRVLRRARTWMLTGGEDHGILATFPPAAALPDGYRRIGVVRGAGAESPPRVLIDGADPAALGVNSSGWDHFAGV